MTFLSDTEKQQIQQAIAEAEQHTSGELITVIAQQADDYLYVTLMWAALIALAVPGLVGLAGSETLMAWRYPLQIIVFFVLAVLFRWPPLTLQLVPRAIRQRRAHRLALEQFLSHNLHQTRDRTGVLLFVSVFEHYVEIIADEGIDRRVPQSEWDAIVADFVVAVRSGQVAEGFLNAVAACDRLLSTHFPPRPDDENELPDHLIEI